MNQTNQKAEKRIPIRRRVMFIVLLTTLAAILAASLTGIICIRWVRDSSEAALTRQLEHNMKSIVQQKAVAADAKLEHYEKYIEFVNDYIENMYAHEKIMIERGRLFYAPEDTHEYALTRVFAAADLNAEDFADELLFFSNLEGVWEPIAKGNDGLITTLYAGTRSGLLTSYDKWSYLSVPVDGPETIYDYFQSGWYTQGMEEDGVFYTGLYVDSQGRGLTITVAAPFRNTRGEIAGVNCADFDITGLYDELISLDLGEGSFSFALDRDDAVISPDAEGLSAEDYTGLTSEEIKSLKTADGILEKNDAVYVCIPVERVGWTLCACVPKQVIQSEIKDADRSIQYATLSFLSVAALIIVIAAFMVNKAARSITYPMELLGRDMKVISDGDLGYRATVYRNDEIGDITSQMNEMVDRLNFTLNELMSTQRQADAMSLLATRDSLTGIRNKTAYDEQVRILEQEIPEGGVEFGLLMIDLNNLKLINDNYGHARGDIAIKKLCKTICGVFSHSPVYRVGGDEFVVLLRDEDLRNADALTETFREKMIESSEDSSAAPWERISAAIGCAFYDEKLDKNVSSVLVRADKEMYSCKEAMKSV
ncbi:MAG: diguanylate cyclase [Oscillospiraceae bacterium]|nr:diguanylate cyclase [Oscillospiraceae bacterium]